MFSIKDGVLAPLSTKSSYSAILSGALLRFRFQLRCGLALCRNLPSSEIQVQNYRSKAGIN
jgi:hypothetical protein